MVLPLCLFLALIGELESLWFTVLLYRVCHNLGTTFAYLVPISTPTGYLSLPLDPVAADLYLTIVVLSLATNLITTLLIAFRLWYISSWSCQRFLLTFCRVYQKSIANDLGSGRKSSPVQKVMLLLVESGAIYCMFQVSFYSSAYLSGS